ncbi:SAM-dependent methyltransferases [Candidatus Termititenax persephonae]|uniref:SAM-dependent methyltransferases n=1 Tax=Candidatus Termititenax persephonae TaxID=2218525 RepID=A0A388TIM5_9BACT|nr:SAM-dependent methyltransferases [Candidatus Termititenax persephonae]
MQAVSYNSRATQYARFAALLQHTVPQAAEKLTLLDLGCGLGDMYSYLQRNGYRHIAYTGLDLVPEMVAAAQKNHPAAEFKQADFVQDPIGKYDIICASGSLNIIFDQAANHAQYVQAVIQKMYEQSRIACAFNLLDRDSEHLYEQDPRFYYADKNYFLAFCQMLCPSARLITGYLVNDFTVALEH